MTRGWRLLLGGFMVASLAFVNPYVRGDGNGYYAWLVSPIVDGDLDFVNQYRHADPFFATLMFDPDGTPRASMRTVTGHIGDQWSVGPAILWSPFFLAAHAVVHAARHWYPGLAADGYGPVYRYACGIGTAIYGWLAVVLAWKCAALAGRASAAGVSALLVWAASPLPMYQFFLPFHVHALAACVVSWFVYLWLKWRSIDTTRRWLAWGAVGGLMTEVYQLNGVLLVLAGWELILAARRAGVARAFADACAFALAALIVWIPQLVGKAIVYGSPWTTGYGDRFFWLSPRLWQTAFSAQHGLFSWTPLALFAAAGLLLAARSAPRLWPLVLTALLFFVCVASYQNWHGQSSFGNRFFLSLFVVGVIGTAELIRRIATGGAVLRGASMACATILVLWNAGLAVQWGTGRIDNKGPIDFRAAARNQMTVVPHEAVRFVKLYFSSRAAAARTVEERDRDSGREYKLSR